MEPISSNLPQLEVLMKDSKFILLNHEVGEPLKPLEAKILQSAKLIIERRYLEAQDVFTGDQDFLDANDIVIEWYSTPLEKQLSPDPSPVEFLADMRGIAAVYSSQGEKSIRLGEFRQSKGGTQLPDIYEREKAILTLEELIHKLQNRNAKSLGLEYEEGIKEIEVALYLHKLGVPLTNFFINGEPLYQRNQLGINSS